MPSFKKKKSFTHGDHSFTRPVFMLKLGLSGPIIDTRDTALNNAQTALKLPYIHHACARTCMRVCIWHSAMPVLHLQCVSESSGNLAKCKVRSAGLGGARILTSSGGMQITWPRTALSVTRDCDNYGHPVQKAHVVEWEGVFPASS